MQQKDLEKNPKISKDSDDLADVLDKVEMPADSRKKIERKIEMRSGPIPSPKELKEYYDIEPEYVDRIFSMAENQQKNNNALQHKTLEGEISLKKDEIATEYKRQVWGMVLGGIIILAFLIVGTFLIMNKHTITGIIFLALAFIPVIGLFINKDYKNNEVPEIKTDEYSDSNENDKTK